MITWMGPWNIKKGTSQDNLNVVRIFLNVTLCIFFSFLKNPSTS